jgi:hypothetical protein
MAYISHTIWVSLLPFLINFFLVRKRNDLRIKKIRLLTQFILLVF